MINVTSVCNRYFGISGRPETMDKELCIKAVSEIVESLKENGLTVEQAQEVLKISKTALLYSKVE